MTHRFLLLLIAIIASATILAAKTDSVSMGPQYRDQVFFNLASGETGRSPNASWHLAFSISGLTGTVTTNGALGLELRHVKGASFDDWSTIDTTGWQSWPTLNNNASDWMEGAFNRIRDTESAFDFGWGQYSMITHTVSGTAVYLIKLPDNTVRKIRIDGLASRTWTFTHANLDGSDERTGTINRNDYQGKLFAYWDLTTNLAIDREPNANSWHLTFTRYMEPIPTGPGVTTDYPVMGILANPMCAIAVVGAEDPLTATAPTDTAAYTDEADAIGSQWKRFTAGRWSLNDSTAWFIRTAGNEIFRFVPTGFSGGSTGTTTFNLSNVVSNVDENGSSQRLAVWPSVAERGTKVSLILDGVWEGAHISVHDVMGVTTYSTVLATTGTFSALQIPTSALAAGRYWIHVSTAGRTSSISFAIQ
jgi:hypothetical protein